MWDDADSGWGSVALTYKPLSAQTQYFNLVVNGDWKVMNMTLGAFQGLGQDAVVTFNFGLDAASGSPIDYGYLISDSPLGLLDKPADAAVAILGTRQIIGSINEGVTPWALGAPPAPLAGGEVAADGGLHAKFPNQECKENHCVPTSVSNSLQWLNKTYNLKMPEDKITSDALADALGTTDEGTPLGWWEKKEKYLKDNKLPVVQTVSEAIKDAEKALKDGKDVEMGAGGHRAALVKVTPLKDGRYELSVAHDTKQGEEGGTTIEKGIYDPTTGKITGITFMDDETLRNFVIESPVPEPATWMMLVGGFGLAGFWMRSNRVRRMGLSYR